MVIHWDEEYRQEKDGSLTKDEKGNAARGDVLIENSRNCYVHADHRLVSLLGVEDLFVIETSDAILVADKQAAQDVKKIVNRLTDAKRTEIDLHREVFRPWGSYDSLGSGSRYQVKSIRVKPGAKLSLQYHHHRAEHWVIVKGTAWVQLGDLYYRLNENDHVYIPKGEKHRIENSSDTVLEFIETQVGNYLGEDDIIRYEDDYGRV